MRSKNFVFHLIFGIMLMLFIAVVVYLTAKCDVKPLADTEYDKTAPFENGWHTADGTPLDAGTLRKINSVSSDDEISIYNTLPTTNSGDADALFFRAKNIFYSVYIDGEPVYTPEFGESVFYTNSTGTRWNSIDITPEQLGKEVEIRIRAAYKTARCGIDSFRLGSSGGVILNILKEKLVSFITCILLLFVGVLLSIADIPINMRNQKNHELLFLGLFSICVSIWYLAELHIIEFFFDDSRLVQMVSCCSLMLIPFALILYLNAAIGFKNRFIFPVLCGLCTLGFVVSWTLHFLKIKDIHETLTLSHINVVIASVLLISTVIKSTVQMGRESGVNIYLILRTVGLCSIAVTAIIDMVRYYSGQTSDSAMFMRVGMLIFTVCYGSSSLENTINAVKMGAQAEFASRLAYRDGLTGIGNRTAFEERLGELENAKDSAPVGIVMFDVNDLKYVNDNLGHPLGDSMIKKAAEIVSGSFETDECFRIGGDEFAVIMRGDNIKERCDKSLSDFSARTERHNSTPDNEFRISIAHGFFIYDNECGLEHITDAYKAADEKMYENKREMKARQSTPEQYYSELRRLRTERVK
ncbi:MAG: GGDEF domain-containing protein [Ruminococcaceae bacterium]|nr:GGDEF domain-containing protein [Oscillospiraceae bacterium]